MEILGWDAWAEKYKPIKNKFSKHDETMFETYGDEVEFVQAQDPRYVWTNVQGDMSDIIVAGYAYVNRLCYYITEIPWEDEDEYVLISVEVECECYSEDEDVMESRGGESGDPDCTICEGYGLKTEYVG
jgi:hypothetical protein